MGVFIEPAVNVYSREELISRLRLAADMAPRVQIDVTDGEFAEPPNMADPKIVKQILSPEKIHLHLMVKDVAAEIGKWQAVSPCLITFHLEAAPDPREHFNLLQSGGIQRGLALTPQTPLDSFFPYQQETDFLLMLGVSPGKSGQTFDTATLDRLKTAAVRARSVPLGVDGGVTKELVPELVKAGVSVISAGSAIFSVPDPLRAYAELEKAAREAELFG